VPFLVSEAGRVALPAICDKPGILLGAN
jgi:hypothetical protein